MGVLNVVFHKKVRPSKNAIMLVGLPGVGFLGRLVADFFIKELKAERIASIYSSTFPAQIITAQGGVSHALRDDVFLIRQKGRKPNIFILIGDAQPDLPPKGSVESQHAFCNELADFARRLGVDKVVTIAGLLTPERAISGVQVTVVATEQKIIKNLKGKIKIQPPGLPINGGAGLLLQYAGSQGMEGMCIIGTTGPQPQIPDMGAAYEVAKVISEVFNIDIKLSGFKIKSKKFEKSLKEAMASYGPPNGDKEKFPTYIR